MYMAKNDCFANNWHYWQLVGYELQRAFCRTPRGKYCMALGQLCRLAGEKDVTRL